ncbi:MAG TPA: tetratricopeptide repeat protein [Gemmataceae bacterium]|nr:tetratricopeptide repeat protein [Gemmataceae bacterium]
MRRQIRFGRAAVVLVVVAVLGVGVYSLHAFQVRRTSSALLDQATAAEKAGDLEKSADYFARYLGLHPDDDDALAKYGLVLDKLAKTPRQKGRAYLVLSQAIARSPEKDDVRRRLATLAVEIGRTKDAREQLDYLLKHSAPNDAELESLHGRCEEAEGQFEKAAKDYEKAVADGPHQVNTYVRWAAVLRRRLADPKGADDVMDRMVANNPDSFQARLARGRYLREIGLLEAGAKDVAYARDKLAPTETDVLLASADVVQENGDTEAARRDLEDGLKLHPDEPRFLLGLAALELRSGPDGREKALARLDAARTLLAGHAEGLWNVADLYIDAGRPDKAKDVLKDLKADGVSPATDYLQARLDVDAGHYAAAAALLEERRPQLAASPEMTRQTDVLLGLCYQRLGNPDQQLAAFSRAADEARDWPPALLGRASGLLAVGKSDEALVEYNDIVQRDPRQLDARIQAVRLLILRNLRLPADKQDWKPAEILLNAAPEDQHKAVDFRLAQIDLLAARGQTDEARKQLEDARKNDPKEIRYWLALAALADRDAGPDGAKDPAKALAVLDDAQRALGDRVDLRLARAACIARMAPDEAVKRLPALEPGPDAFDAGERLRLLTGLADAYRRAGAPDAALRLCNQARTDAPDDLGVLLRLFDLSVETKDLAALPGLVDAIRDKEGTDGATWRCCEAARLILAARGGDKTDLPAARDLAAAAAKSRPTWSRPPLLEAEIDELAGDADAAADKYDKAVELGERRPEAIGQAAALQIKRGRPDKAKQLLEKLGDDKALFDEGLGRLATLASLMSRDSKERTLALANAAAAKDLTDYRSQLWLGEVCWATGDRTQAETAFRAALKLKPSAPETWKALILCLIDGGHKDAAEAEMNNAKTAVSAEDAPGVLAVGYEALGKRDKAEEQYVALMTAKPDAGRLRDAAAFYLRGGDVKKAEPLLHRIIDEGRNDAVVVAWARRSLALAWAATGDYKQSQDALDLIDKNLAIHKTPEDQRAQALVLAMRPGGRRDAIQVLETSFAQQRPTPDEEFLLARLYEANHNWDQANQHFLSIATAAEGVNPMHLAYYVLALLRHKDANAAAHYLQDLVKLDPGSFRTAAVKAKVLQKQGDAAAAGKVLTDYAESHKGDPALLGETAALLEEVGLTAVAEDYYRKYVAEVGDQHPEKKILLAAFLARHDRLDGALDVIDSVWDKVGPKVGVREEVAAIRIGHPTAMQYQRVEARVQDAVRADPKDADLLVSLADLQDAQGRHDEAVKIYQQILKDSPRNVLALNNLAWLQAFRGDAQAESLSLVDRAIAVAGPAGSLLDTKGVILLKLGKPAEAVRVLSDATEQLPTASVYFHLAEAQKAMPGGSRSEAEKAWQKAQDLDLKEADLHPLERPDYQKWLAERKNG